ncbi:MAG TPA: GNAT family N-acetyltransferase [Steroidobacteraceae bacterium]|nr:GNAT family N-acetyltransferase [Steroidobacteraceae bacterium]
MHGLDRPVWESLSTYHGRLAEGDDRARRFVRDVNVFASSRDDDPEALAALADLVRPGESVYLLQAPRIAIPAALTALREAKGVQMIAPLGTPFEPPQHDMLPLADADAPEMLALAKLTEPGPFLPRTHLMGSFLGIRIAGRLAAMAGERMRFPGHTEVSGVCTHPDFRGRGLARRLSAAVAHRIQARGEQAFLHAWKSNHAAIALYGSLGFVLRTEVNVAELRRDSSP